MKLRMHFRTPQTLEPLAAPGPFASQADTERCHNPLGPQMLLLAVLTCMCVCSKCFMGNEVLSQHFLVINSWANLSLPPPPKHFTNKRSVITRAWVFSHLNSWKTWLTESSRGQVIPPPPPLQRARLMPLDVAMLLTASAAC